MKTLVDKLKFKICVLGDASVGKTSLIHHYCEGFFKESYLSTIGVAFLTKTMDLNHSGKNVKVTLQIWDIGGQDLFAKLRANYLKGSQGAFVMFDITNKNSLVHIDAWMDELVHALFIKDVSKFPIVVIGNKIDLPYDSKIKERAAQFLQSQYNISLPITYTSAKTGEGMIDAFETLTKTIIKQFGD